MRAGAYYFHRQEFPNEMLRKERAGLKGDDIQDAIK